MEGKVAIVTGSAQGIGKEIAQILLEKNVKVCISDIQEDVGRSTLAEFEEKFGKENVVLQLCDVVKENDLEELFKRAVEVFGRLDILVNNAGVAYENRHKFMTSINMAAMVDGTLLGIRHMGTDNGGRGGVIVNMASISGLIPLDPVPHYTAGKHAIVGFSRALGRVSSKIHGVRVNAICPVFVDTEFVRMPEDEIKQGRMYGPDSQTRMMKHVQECGAMLITPRSVAEGCLQLLENGELSGDVMVVGPEGPVILTEMPTTLDEVLKMYTKK